MPFGFHPVYLVALLLLLALVVAAVIVVAGAVRSYRTYGLRSPDGRWWWDGSRWQPLPPEQE